MMDVCVRVYVGGNCMWVVFVAFYLPFLSAVSVHGCIHAREEKVIVLFIYI